MLTRFLRRILQHIAESLNGSIDTFVEFDDGVIRPELLANFFAEHYFTGMLQQHHQYLYGLLAQPDANAVLSQFAGADFELEGAKAVAAGL